MHIRQLLPSRILPLFSPLEPAVIPRLHASAPDRDTHRCSPFRKRPSRSLSLVHLSLCILPPSTTPDQKEPSSRFLLCNNVSRCLAESLCLRVVGTCPLGSSWWLAPEICHSTTPHCSSLQRESHSPWQTSQRHGVRSKSKLCLTGKRHV